MAYIYKITNQLNQKAYIGKTEHLNPHRRWTEHQADARNPNRNHRALYKAINKYGIENFIFEVIENTKSPEEREIYYIQYYDTYHNGYNETLGGDGSKYLDLPEQDICKYYLKRQSIKATADYLAHDRATIRKILYKNNIKIFDAKDLAKERQSKAVAKSDKETNEILEIYPSISEAERQNNCHMHIRSVCNGKRKTAGGYKWEFITE